jgi:hypothetical protein
MIQFAVTVSRVRHLEHERAIAQDPARLLERPPPVRHVAQDIHRDRAVECGVPERQMLAVGDDERGAQLGRRATQHLRREVRQRHPKPGLGRRSHEVARAAADVQQRAPGRLPQRFGDRP